MVKPRIRHFTPVPRASSPQVQTRPSSASDNPKPIGALQTRPLSGTSSSSNSSTTDVMAAKPPTLKDILVDAAPPPWTLSAFMAYLSQNHCMETLEFTLDSKRYADSYNQPCSDDSSSREASQRLCDWWRKLMHIYIVPCAPREVNIPSRVRDRLLNLPHDLCPPHPSELDEAGRIIYELMNDSLLVPFLQSVAPLHNANSNEESPRSPRHSAGRATGLPTTTAAQADSEGLTDDSDSNSPTALEPMTPPTTPPTSEYTFNTSPGGFQRAFAAHSKGWKKVGAKLGFNRKASSRRPTPSSSSTECESAYTSTNHSNND
ncbi:hypothetical protein CDD83_3295 [Cordyceps sp. RAO-2017]|nr:hypothetical protein CDD83_3295 [Cordyceps sp. RAO-2017]